MRGSGGGSWGGGEEGAMRGLRRDVSAVNHLSEGGGRGGGGDGGGRWLCMDSDLTTASH